MGLAENGFLGRSETSEVRSGFAWELRRVDGTVREREIKKVRVSGKTKSKC